MPATLTFTTSGKILVTEGEKIPEGKLLAEEAVNSVININISKLLMVSPKKCQNLLFKKPGDKIKTSEILAGKKLLLGLKKRSIKAPCNGEISSLEVNSGQLTISLPSEKKSLISPVAGQIKKIDQNKITLAIKGEEIELKEAIGSTIKGEILVFKTEEIDHLALDKNIEGKIICSKIFQREAIEKAIALGAVAIISCSIFDDDWEDFKEGKDLSILIQAGELVNNIGIIGETELKVLLSYQGKKAIFLPANKKLIIEE